LGAAKMKNQSMPCQYPLRLMLFSGVGCWLFVVSCLLALWERPFSGVGLSWVVFYTLPDLWLEKYSKILK